MRIQPGIEKQEERGVAMVTTLMLTLLLSMLVGAMLAASTSDVLISSNELRTDQAFYIAEAGINRGAGWFSSKFGADPNSGRYVLPEQNPSNTTGKAGKLNYTDVPYYQKGAEASSPEQKIPTSVKVLVDGALQNVVLAGEDSDANTFPATYTVNANDTGGVAKNFTYNAVVEDFTNNLVNQREGDGKFSVRATLISIVPPSGEQQGTVTWLLESRGRITRGSNDTEMANATLYAYISARVSPLTRTITEEKEGPLVGAGPGVIGRGMVTWNSSSMRVDSYKSSLGRYGAGMAAGSFPGQIGSNNIGSRGDVRTNNDTFPGINDGKPGYIDMKNGTVTGNPYATLPAPAGGEEWDPITMENIDDGRGGQLTEEDKKYKQPQLVFPPLSDPAPPAPGARDFTWDRDRSGTLPGGNYNNITITKGTLVVPPGNYGTIDLTNSKGTIVLGVPGQSTVYNLQGFVAGAQATIRYAGPVTINVKSSLDVGAGTDVSSDVQPASIRWNFVGGASERVYLGGHSAIVGVFYAPNNDIEIRGTGDFYGAVAGRTVDIRGTGAFHVDEDAVSGVLSKSTYFDVTSSIVGYSASKYSLWRITQTIN